jgi:hypothetical protein
MIAALVSAVLALWSFASPSITHSAVTPEIDAALAHALGAWGASSAISDAGPGTDIVAVWGDTPMVSQAYPDICYEHDPACAATPGEIRSCVIEVDPWWAEHAERQWAQDMITHEVGHCLGLIHPGVSPSIMEAITDGFSPYDAETIAALYPRTEPVVEVYRVFVPSLTASR